MKDEKAHNGAEWKREKRLVSLAQDLVGLHEKLQSTLRTEHNPSAEQKKKENTASFWVVVSTSSIAAILYVDAQTLQNSIVGLDRADNEKRKLVCHHAS